MLLAVGCRQVECGVQAGCSITWWKVWSLVGPAGGVTVGSLRLLVCTKRGCRNLIGWHRVHRARHRGVTPATCTGAKHPQQKGAGLLLLHTPRDSGVRGDELSVLQSERGYAIHPPPEERRPRGLTPSGRPGSGAADMTAPGAGWCR